MRVIDSIYDRRYTLLFIALFSCVQITSGVFLIMGKGTNSAQPQTKDHIYLEKLAYKDINDSAFLSNDLNSITIISSINKRTIHTD
ncbi:MAG: hypothetical protein ACRBB3_03485 [Alphaproteobacteria bacterium]